MLIEIHDAKKYLHALLEGKIQPGSEMWKKIWTDKEFELVGQTFLELKNIRPEDLSPAWEKIWSRIEQVRPLGTNRRPSRRRWMRYAAAALLPLLVGAWWFLNNLQQPFTTEPEELSLPHVTNNRAVLVMGNGEQMELSSIASDTAWQQAGATITLDSAKTLSYKSGRSPQSAPEYNTMIVPRTGEYQLVLSDGTKVFLNSESKLRFPVSFGGGSRQVFLEGEAYFEVAQTKAHPFIVTAGNVEVRALGTKFDINTHALKEGILATLLSGSIRVSTHDDVCNVILKPDQQAAVSGEKITVREVDASLYVSWSYGRFRFDGATLEKIAGQLERWYDVEFVFTDEELEGSLFTGMFKREYSIEQAISIIAKTTRVKFEKNGDTITVSR